LGVVYLFIYYCVELCAEYNTQVFARIIQINKKCSVNRLVINDANSLMQKKKRKPKDKKLITAKITKLQFMQYMDCLDYKEIAD